jgi:peroxin-14
MIAPPTAPQLEQDKQAIDEQFEKAFSLLDQLSKDTEVLKTAEEARTERLDAALSEVESVISDLKGASRRREDDARRVSDEVRGLKDLIPKAMEVQKETTDSRLRELNTELKSLKTLMSQRLNPATAPATVSPSTYSRPTGVNTPNSSSPIPTNGISATETTSPKPASVSNGTTESIVSVQGRSGSPFNTGAPTGRAAAIPSWQLAAGNKNSSNTNTNSTTAGGSQESSGAA